MEKLDPKVDGATPDIVEQNVEQLKALFPEIVTEGRVDFDTLREVLGDYTDDRDERYSFTWNGKSRARRLAQSRSTGTLRPCPEESVNWDTTQNLFIEGDNLEVLKLLQKSYHKKVKMIYIDPPYNTGKDFIYPDNFRDSIGNYLKITGQVDEEGRKLSANPETSGKYHTNWLNMMYPRLKLARNLLRDDGVLFMTIDDTEVAKLRSICDEIFGEENFVANVVWQKKYAVANDDPGIGVMHDHILVYRRSSDFARRLLPRTKEQDARYTNPDNDHRGDWASDNYVSNKSRDERPTLWYAIKHPRTGEEVWPDEHAVWRYSREKHLEIEQQGRLYWGPDQTYKKPRLKRYLSEVQQGTVPPTWWTFGECGHNDEAQKETASLIGKKVFSTPKPIRLLRRMLTIGTEKDALVLDFFAGSGSTGHAAMTHNVMDGGNRRFILVQLPEPLDPSDKDQKIAAEFCDSLGKPRNIAEITKERLRRASRRLKEENQMFGGDLGFRVLKLDTSNIKPWDAEFEDVEGALLSSVENVKPDRSEADVLYELLLKFGLDLAVPTEERNIAGKTVHIIGAGALIVCLADEIGLDVVEGIAALKIELSPETICVVFKDSGFADDVVKTNAVQILHQAGIDDVKSL